VPIVEAQLSNSVVQATRIVAIVKMLRFANEEYADMHFVYGFCDGNALAALREYQFRYADWRQPCRRVFETVLRNMRETGIVMPRAPVGRGRRNVRDEEDVLAIVHDNTSTSTRQDSSVSGRLSQGAAWRTLHENQLHSFHVQPVEGLQPEDKHLRLQFSGWVLHMIVDTPQFLCRVLWTDEAVSTRSGVHNLHNLYVWATENLHANRHSSLQHRFSVNV
jgi:hypothetical protein